MNYTANYQLPQWVETDRILRTDFNNMTEAIDAALDGLREDVDENTGSLAAKGNCQFYSTSYVGTDSNLPITQTFPGKPMVVMVVQESNGYCLLTWRGHGWGLENFNVDVTWGDNSITWYCQGNNTASFDDAYHTYHVLALLQQGA